ncbi:MAG: OmpA family protein, partial [Parasphingorhabdus sp.]
MRYISRNPKITLMLVTAAMLAPASVSAQVDREDIIVSGQGMEDAYATMPDANAPEGPEVEGIITARKDNLMEVTGSDGSKTVVAFNEST